MGRLRPNDLGLFDTLGNVWEWVEDPRSDYYGDQLNDKENPLQLRLKDQTLRFLRGGSFFVFAVNVRCANRFSARPATDDNSFGFRPARTYPD